MGARVYIPTLGRFLSVDPIEGGTNNNYVYPTNPVAMHDINGMWAQIIAKGFQLVWNGAKWIWKGSSKPASKAVKPSISAIRSRAIKDIRINVDHGGRKNRTGLSINQARDAIIKDIKANKGRLRTDKSQEFKTKIGKTNLCYRAKIINDSYVNVGTYYTKGC